MKIIIISRDLVILYSYSVIDMITMALALVLVCLQFYPVSLKGPLNCIAHTTHPIGYCCCMSPSPTCWTRVSEVKNIMAKGPSRPQVEGGHSQNWMIVGWTSHTYSPSPTYSVTFDGKSLTWCDTWLTRYQISVFS